MPRTWTVTLPTTEPHAARVVAFDEREALELASKALGISIEPCCEIGDEPCEACKEDARLDADMRAESRADDERYQRERGGR